MLNQKTLPSKTLVSSKLVVCDVVVVGKTVCTTQYQHIKELFVSVMNNGNAD